MTDQPSGDDGEASHRSASEQLDSFRDPARMDDAGIFNATTWDSVRHLAFKAAYYDCFQMYEEDTLYQLGCFATLAEVEDACRSFIDDQLRKTGSLESLLSFGNLPLIVEAPVKSSFSGIDYAKKRATELFGAK